MRDFKQMQKVIFRYYDLSVLLLIILILFFDTGFANGEIIFRNIETNMSSANNKKEFRFITFWGREESVFVDIQKEPLLIMPNDKIDNVSLIYDTCLNLLDVGLAIDLKESFSKQFEEFTKKNLRQQIAIFIDDDFVAAHTIIVPLKKSFTVVGSQPSYERLMRAVINNGFKPDYDERCMGKEIKVVNLTAKYKFKSDYVDKKAYYPSILTTSEFWHVRKTTQIYDKPNGKAIATIPAKKIIEHYYNANSQTFEKKDNWLKIIYHGDMGWIKNNDIIPLFSILDTNIFLQKYFVFNEKKYKAYIQDRKMFTDYLIEKASVIRSLYISEAMQRFKDKVEFDRWYFDTFKKTFEK